MLKYLRKIVSSARIGVEAPEPTLTGAVYVPAPSKLTAITGKFICGQLVSKFTRTCPIAGKFPGNYNALARYSNPFSQWVACISAKRF